MGIDNGPCIKSFERADIQKHILSCRELDRDHFEIMIMGKLCAFMNANGATTRFRHNGKTVCRDSFLFIHGIKKSKFDAIRGHYQANGLTTRCHGNKGRIPSNATSYTSTQEVKTYIQEYSERKGLFLPGRTPGHRVDNDETMYIPSHESKASIHRQYVKDCKSANMKSVSYDVFARIWNTFLSHIHTIDPRTDLCFQCQQNNELIIRSTNTEDVAKRAAIQTQQEHLMLADLQSNDYKQRIQIAKKSYVDFNPDISFGPKTPNSVPVTSAYSFDFAQQISIPHNPDQPGAIFFKTPRKIGLFGINNEALNMQTNFVIDESVATGKGSNTVVSYIHFYLENYGLGEEKMHLQADNCCGQNKNNIMIQYLCWRILCGLHSEISLNFMIAGHTKFSVDRCFGLLKRKYARTFCSSLFDVAKVIDDSSENGTNVCQLVGMQDGQTIVSTYEWKERFEKLFKKIPGISKYHHFRLTKENPGCVFVREFAHHKDEMQVKIIENPNGYIWNANDLPNFINPSGLSRDRKEYLYKEIRQFGRHGTEDLVAPKP